MPVRVSLLVFLAISFALSACDSSSTENGQADDLQYIVIVRNVIQDLSHFGGESTFYYPDGEDTTISDIFTAVPSGTTGSMTTLVSEAGAVGLTIDWEVYAGRVRVEVIRGVGTANEHEGDVILAVEETAGGSISFSHGSVD